MTAMNLIVQAKAGAAFLLTDTASYTADGTIAQFRSKVTAVEVGKTASVAIATTGLPFSRHLQRRMRALRVDSIEAFLAAFPAAFREVEQQVIAEGTPARCGTDQMAAVVAVFDRETRQASGYAICNQRGLFPDPSYRPYSLPTVRRYLTRFEGQPFVHGTDLSDPAQWDPYEGAEALIEAQRADLFGLGGSTYPAVGGQAILTRIDAAGVTQHVVKTWFDRTKRRIDLATVPTPFGARMLARWGNAMRPAMPRIRTGAPEIIRSDLARRVLLLDS